LASFGRQVPLLRSGSQFLRTFWVLSPTASQRVPGFRNEIFFTRSRKLGTRPKGGESEPTGEDKPGTHPQDGESEQREDKKGHLWMETNLEGPEGM